MGFGALTSLPVKKPKSKPLTRAKVVVGGQKRRPLTDEIIYGDVLFASSRKKEKEIVVCFFPYTKNKMRLSTDGKFIIQYAQLDADDEGNIEFFSLFYLKQHSLLEFDTGNIDSETGSKILERISIDNVTKQIIIPSKEVCVIEKTPHLIEIEEKIIECVKSEYAIERLKKLEDLKLEEAQIKIEKDKQEAIEDAKLEKEQENELEPRSGEEFSDNVNSQINNEAHNEQKVAPISQQAQQTDEINANKSPETRKVGGFSFREIK